jgi:hypothetical protein
MNKFSRSAVAAIVLALTAAATSEATVIRVGSTVPIILASSRGNATAYDPVNHVYLVVSANGVVWGRFVDRNGNIVGAAFAIQGNPAIYGAYPRATFSPNANNGAGGFLINWFQADTSTAWILHGRMVAFGQNGAYGPDSVLTPDGGFGEQAAYGAYSTGSQEFLVVYRTINYVIRAVRVNLGAAPIAAPVTISQTAQFENNPSVAYNPVTNEYLACWTMFTAANTGLLGCQMVQAGTGALVGGEIPVQATGSVWFTDTTYNPTTNQFLVTWDETHGSITNARLVNADGSLPGGVIAVSRTFAAYDGTATAYNPVTQSFFVVAYDLTGDLTQDGGVELTSAGQPVDSGLQVTTGCNSGVKCASYYPQIAASTEDPNWLVTTSQSFVDTAYQMLQGQAASGAPTPPTNTPPTTTPPATPRPMLAVDTPANNATVYSNGFMVAGWAADGGAASGTGVDVVVAWASPANGGSAILAGIANYGYSRPDVAAAIGSQFAATGYGMTATLPVGTYSLLVYAHSTVNNSWNTPTVRTITVMPPPSRPLMWIDAPVQNQTLSQNIVVTGWAVDTAAASGSGVDAIDVYGFPTAGGAPILVGVGSTGGSRPDVGAALGSAQFASAGFTVSGTLPPGSYTLVAYSHSVIGGFNASMAIAVTVR